MCVFIAMHVVFIYALIKYLHATKNRMYSLLSRSQYKWKRSEQKLCVRTFEMVFLLEDLKHIGVNYRIYYKCDPINQAISQCSMRCFFAKRGNRRAFQRIAKWIWRENALYKSNQWIPHQVIECTHRKYYIFLC